MGHNGIFEIIDSWENETGNVNKTEELLDWIKTLNNNTYVNINECSINDSTFWFYDDYNGEVLNRKRSFFSVKGMRLFIDDKFIKEQPIIVQPEIGYLGIICKKIDGVLNFLMQAKIEPGNINCVQISPTIQATKSNFTRAHGGKIPLYFEYFENSDKYDVIYDQIQSEQASRFYKKRNRNMIMMVDEDIEIYPNFKWMTLGQIKKLMDIDNLVNMDTRTVLSGIPFVLYSLSDKEKEEIKEKFSDKALFESIFNGDYNKYLPLVYQNINNYKMFKEVTLATVPLNQLVDWTVDEYGITCKNQADFMVRYYDIEISGREVRHWSQPLFKAIGIATFGLLSKVKENKRLYLVKIKPEIGSFDRVELGPTVQWEPTHYLYNDDVVEKFFRKKVESREGISVDVMLSEEGGRFYHEQNRNIIVECKEEELLEISEEYIWVDFATLNFMTQINNGVNIQLRNLLSLIKI
ncbi:MAG: NDP-hexose 2,3-dehydratase family protein [Butyrivibrio sp.]|nr:NDP-hexose 2,3-dehydratase family protein [Butyrivibrio sp.]